MSVTDWSARPEENRVVDPAVPALDGTSYRQVPGALRGIMAGVAAQALDRSGDLVTAGTGNTYTVRTNSGIREFRSGLALLVRIDRSNTGPAAFVADGLPSKPWLNRDGLEFETGQLADGLFVWVIADEKRNAWTSDVFGGLTVALLDAVMRNWWASLPDDPRGIGPSAPWRNGEIVQWTSQSNPAFTVQSPEGRRMALTLMAEALPDSPDGLGPREPWLSGDSFAFTPKT